MYEFIRVYDHLIGDSRVVVSATWGWAQPEGMAATYWVSKIENSLPHVIGTMSFPLGATTPESVWREIDGKVSIVAEALNNLYNGVGSPRTVRSTDNMLHVAQHLKAYQQKDAFSYLTDVERTAALYTLFIGFGLSDYAKRIAEVENIKLRTITDRLYRARKQNII